MSSSNNNNNNSSSESLQERTNDVVKEEEPGGETASNSEENADKSEENRFFEANADAVNKKDEDDKSTVGIENQSSSSGKSSSSSKTGKKSDARNGKRGKKRDGSGDVVGADYDSMLLQFDDFASEERKGEGEGEGEGIGYGFKIGDMVWGKVKSHPWWPGHIYNEAFANASVRRTKHEGHVLVAFFGDSSYGWFDPAELIPFDENFAEKSRQTYSRSFVKAVEEAVDEMSRRQALGFACRCRNKYNIWPTKVDGYFTVDVGDYEPVVYSRSQIQVARDRFQTGEMVAFMQQLALSPSAEEHPSLDFIKSKATVLACRRALFEEFDETYAQAFGTVPTRPERPTEPAVVDPSKAPLSGRMVFAEALNKGKNSAKSIKAKDQGEKEKYLFKRRDEATEVKTKKANLGHVVSSDQPLMVDGSGFSGKVVYPPTLEHTHPSSKPGVSEGSELHTGHPAAAKDLSTEKIKDDLTGSKKLVDGALKKAKVHKRPAGDLRSDDTILVEKKKKKRKKETSAACSTDQSVIPGAASKTIVPDASKTVVLDDKVSGTAAEVSPGGGNLGQNQNKNNLVAASSHPVETQQSVGVCNGDPELLMVLKDLQALALDPFHGVENNRPSTTRQVFLKFRALSYQKSSVVLAPAQNESNEARPSKLPTPTALASPGIPADIKKEESPTVKPMKPVKPTVRHEDSMKGGRKREPSDRLEDISAKKKKKISDMKQLVAEKKNTVQKVTDAPRSDVKEAGPKSVPKIKTLKVESRRMEPPVRAKDPTMLVMKFPPGGALPSIAELKAKFARFGPLDHSGTRVFWKSYTCRLVYQRKVHAQAAYNFAVSSHNLFGNSNVRCHLRELEAEMPESEPVRIPKENASLGVPQQRENPADLRPAARSTSQPLQQQVQLKSCLKKPPSGDEGGNGGGRGSRVKFVLGGEESGRVDQMLSGNKDINNVGNFPEGASSSAHFVDVNSKDLPRTSPLPSTQLSNQLNFSSNVPLAEQMPRTFNAQHMPATTTNNDIGQQMLNLLTRCNDVVNNLTGILGYVPYHTL